MTSTIYSIIKKYGWLFFIAILIIMKFIWIQHKNSQQFTSNMIGIYWGAFDPPTTAHQAIIQNAINKLRFKKLIIVINNNSYKNYMHSLEERKQMIQNILNQLETKNVEILSQDDSQKINCAALHQLTTEPICAIAGYDAYILWHNYSSERERDEYDAIAVVPRGDTKPTLLDKKAFLMPIDPSYKYTSSTKIRNQIILLK